MDDANSPETDPNSSMSSVLGVKGPLRFRPHGSNQKAHVILRRVTLSEDNGDSGNFSTVVRFSLFAQKRIEVKPGKEILLAVASEDGRFSDLPVIIEGDRAMPQTFEEDNFAQFADEERQGLITSRVSQTMPPRMRRAWTKKLEVSPSIEELSTPSTMRTSIGVQVEPLYIDSGVQTQAVDESNAAATESTYDPGNFATTTSLSSGASAAVHSSNHRRYISLKVQTDPEMWLTEAASLAVCPVHAPVIDEFSTANQGNDVGRSLSPMELDSTPSSRRASPSPSVSSKEIKAASVKATSHKPPPVPLPSPSSSIASSSGAQDMQLSPVNSRSTSSIRVEKTMPPIPITTENQETDSDITRLVTAQPIIHAQDPIVSPYAPHANAMPRSLSTAYSLDSSQQKERDGITSVSLEPSGLSLPTTPVPSGQRYVFPVTKGIAPALLHGDEYSPRSSLSVPSIPLEDWRRHVQSSAVSSALTGNAVASSSKVTLEHTGNLPMAFVSPNAGPQFSDWAQGKSLAMSASSVNGSLSPIPANSNAPMLDQSRDRRKNGYVDVGGSLTNASSARVTTQVSHSADVVAEKKVVSSTPVERSDIVTPPAEIDSTITSWLSPFDDHCWDADAVPGLTASRGRKSCVEPQNTDKKLLQAESIKGSLSSITPWTDTMSSCIADGRTVQSDTLASSSHAIASVPATSSIEQHKIPPTGSTETSLPSYPMVNYRPCPAETSASPVPRGVKRERSSSLRITPCGESSDTVDMSPGHRYLWQETGRYKWPVLKNDYSANLSGEGNLAVQAISFSSDGSHFALSCADKTLRIWNNAKRAEIARLAHNSPIVDVTWLEGDIGVVTLGEDGIVGKWTRVGGNFWQWAKIVDAGCEKDSDDKTCLAYFRDRIAVSFPKTGVKMWIWQKGTWQAQRSIVRPNVTAIRFVDDGAALLGGTRDGVLWYCEIPNGTLRAYSFLHKAITSLDMNPSGSHVLVGQVGGRARLVSTRQSGNRGAVEVSYSLKEQLQQPGDIHSGYPGAIFAAAGRTVLYGSVDGCVLVWDRSRAIVSYGLEHGKGERLI